MSTSKEIVNEPMAEEKDKLNNESSPQNLSDFIVFGRYTVFVVITYECLLMPQMFNMLFMIFGALAPSVVSCGPNDFHNMSLVESCNALKVAQNKNACEPVLEPQFESLAYEVFSFDDCCLIESLCV